MRRFVILTDREICFFRIFWSGKMRYIFIVLIGVFLLKTIDAQAQPLSDEELAKQKIYTSLEEALEEPDQVYRLSLKRLKKTDSLPEMLFLLKNLQELTVKKSKLLLLNHNIAQLSYLQYLNLDHNRLVKLPEELTDLKYLKKLIISRNHIYKLPENMGNMVALQEIVAWSTDLYTLSESIGKLAETLKLLDLRNIGFRRDEIEKIESLLPKTEILYTNLCDCQNRRD